jgi:hypothetical protein
MLADQPNYLFQDVFKVLKDGDITECSFKTFALECFILHYHNQTNIYIEIINLKAVSVSKLSFSINSMKGTMY